MDDGFSRERIIEIVKEIRNSSIMTTSDAERIAYFRNKYLDFFEKFPKLFMAALDTAFDIRFLNLMLKQRDEIIKEGTVEKLEEVSNNVHEGLNEKYLYPVVPKKKLEELRDKLEREKQESQNE